MIEEHAQFITATIINWEHLLLRERNKQLIISSLKYLVDNKRIQLFSYVIMSNHIHLIWQVEDGNNTPDVLRDFLKYTAQQLLKELRNSPEGLIKYKVDKADRKYKVWQRNTLCVDLWQESVFDQKMDYIHDNPVNAGLCEVPEAYKYSSAKSYEEGIDEFCIFTHYNE